MPPEQSELVVIGKITSVYGIKGWVKVHSFTDPMDNILGYPEVYIRPTGVGSNKADWKPLVFSNIKAHGKGFIAEINGIADREQARLYCQHNIAIEQSLMPELDADDYYWHQLQGLQVFTAEQDRQLLGKVDHLMETGANDVLVVKKCQGSIDRQERLIPLLRDQVVTTIDLKAGFIEVDWDPEF